MLTHILVIGFYNHSNLGDDQYELTIAKLFPDIESIMFANVDKIDTIPKHIDAVVCGGGDIINSYFMDKISKLLVDYIGPVYGISVGFPYQSEAINYINLFDHIFVRTQDDYEFGKEVIGSANIDHIPDLAWMLDQPLQEETFPRKKIAVCLAQPMFFNNPSKESLISVFVDVISRLAKDAECSITMLPFNTNCDSAYECDIDVSNEIMERVLLHDPKIDIELVVETDPLKMLSVLKEHTLVICMRFHSVVFSAVLNVPFVAIQVTQKVKNTLIDFGCKENIINVILDDQYRPIHIDNDTLYNKCMQFIGKPLNINVDESKFIKCRSTVAQLKRKRHVNLRSHTLPFCDVETHVRTLLKKNFCSKDAINIYNGAMTIPTHTHSDFARMIIYAVTGSLNSPCLWGLVENMSKPCFVLKDAVDYIYKFHQTQISSVFVNVTLENKKGLWMKFDTTSREDYSKNHRAGWHFVMTGLKSAFDAKLYGRSSENCIIFDDYVDKTFIWGANTLQCFDIIPYRKPWAGVIHHTFHGANGANGCDTLFQIESFRESLRCCKCLITLSRYLKEQIEEAVRALNYDIPVYALCHPTEFVDNMFTLDKFYSNPNRQIVQIGGWLRNPYPFFTIKTNTLQKAVLYGKDMTNNVPPEDFISNTKLSNANNMFVQGFTSMLEDQIKSVHVISHLDNNAYDELLATNLVFLNLIDASAVNTVIECIVRNTVLIVNRHPAVEEVLGIDYPGFYDSLDQIDCLLDKINIEKTWNYLSCMDKTFFRLDTFLEKIQDVLLGLKKSVILAT